MRAVAVVILTLAVSLGSGPAFAQDWCGLLSSLHMVDARTGWARGVQGGVGTGFVSSIVRTTDGGIHWSDVTPRTPATQQIERRAFSGVGWLSALNAWMSTYMEPQNANGLSTPALFTTSNGGETWKSIILPHGGYLDFINTRDGWLLVPTDGVYRSADGGETWTKVGSTKFSSQILRATFLNLTTGWIVEFGNNRDGQHHLVTRDGGRTWQPLRLPPPPQATGPLEFSIGGAHKFLNSLDGILPVLYGTDKDAGVTFYVTRDGGTTWTYTTPVALKSYSTLGGANLGGGMQQPIYRSSSFVDANHGWVTDGDALYVTSDGGRRWVTIRPGPPFEPFDRVGELDFISTKVGWATGRGPVTAPFLLKTVDGGHTWTDVAQDMSCPRLPPRPVGR
jgi:photosystem II stability/assembly factor-like uncharacterized protein